MVQDDLDDTLADHGLKFAPDPASSNRATVGGGIGNNSTGAHSVRYGITDAYTEELRVSSRTARSSTPARSSSTTGVGRHREKDDREADIYRTVRDVVEENADEIEDRYPTSSAGCRATTSTASSTRTTTASACSTSRSCSSARGHPRRHRRADLSLVTVPEETALALYCFDTLPDAMRAVPVALDFDVSAVELMDDEMFRLAAGSDGYAEYVDPIPAERPRR